MQSSEKGFTLIEIMVVVVIAAILIGAVVVTLPSSDDKLLKEQADRFTALLALSQDEAILQSKDLALHIGSIDYAFYRREGSAWEPYTEKPFQQQKLAGKIQSELLIDGITIKLKTKKPKPQILILSSGEITPFTYILNYPEKSSITLKVNAIGEINRSFKQGK